MNLLSKRKKLS